MTEGVYSRDQVVHSGMMSGVTITLKNVKKGAEDQASQPLTSGRPETSKPDYVNIDLEAVKPGIF